MATRSHPATRASDIRSAAGEGSGLFTGDRVESAAEMARGRTPDASAREKQALRGGPWVAFFLHPPRAKLRRLGA